MKSKLAFAAAIIALCGSSMAATYTFNNGSGATASGIQDVDGRAFRANTAPGDVFTGTAGGTSAGPGVVAVGFFSTDDLAGITSTSTLVSLFTNFGDVTNTFAAAGTGGNRGIFTLSSPLVIVSGSDFAGKNMYLFAGNGLTLNDSTQFLIAKSAIQFLGTDDDIPTATTVTFRPETTTVLFGSVVADMKTTSSDTSVTPGFQMAPIPEPSAALLGALGALGLLRRRRI
jgi:hypothetical protein